MVTRIHYTHTRSHRLIILYTVFYSTHTVPGSRVPVTLNVSQKGKGHSIIIVGYKRGLCREAMNLSSQPKAALH